MTGIAPKADIATGGAGQSVQDTGSVIPPPLSQARAAP